MSASQFSESVHCANVWSQTRCCAQIFFIFTRSDCHTHMQWKAAVWSWRSEADAERGGTKESSSCRKLCWNCDGQWMMTPEVLWFSFRLCLYCILTKLNWNQRGAVSYQRPEDPLLLFLHAVWSARWCWVDFLQAEDDGQLFLRVFRKAGTTSRGALLQDIFTVVLLGGWMAGCDWWTDICWSCIFLWFFVVPSGVTFLFGFFGCLFCFTPPSFLFMSPSCFFELFVNRSDERRQHKRTMCFLCELVWWCVCRDVAVWPFSKNNE